MSAVHSNTALISAIKMEKLVRGHFTDLEVEMEVTGEEASVFVACAS